MWPSWQASGDFDVEAFTAKFPSLAPDRVWRAGEPNLHPRRPAYEDSGFSVRICDEEDLTEALRLCRIFFMKNAAALSWLQERSIPSVLDVGCTIDVPKYLGRSVRVSAGELQWLATLGIDLEFSMYIATEDDDASK